MDFVPLKKQVGNITLLES